VREFNFDGLAGPTYNFGGLSPGNTASTAHGGERSDPRQAALQCLEKMRFVAGLGVGQAVLPPHPRPSFRALRALGFTGSDDAMLSKAAATEGGLPLRICSSAAAMWTANAATVAPSSDTRDARLHLVPANLEAMPHRAIEAETTTAVLRTIFADKERFEVHDPLATGGQLGDEGAANHLRLSVPNRPAVHLFAWGRRADGTGPVPKRFPARQTLEAAQALARELMLEPGRCAFPQQSPEGIDAGAFHTDVLAVGNGAFLMIHEKAFTDTKGTVGWLRDQLGDGLLLMQASEDELPAADAVETYPFNSQVLTLPDGQMAIVAPTESRERPAPRAFLEKILAEGNPVTAVHYLSVRQSMRNGGGPACLRLRIVLNDLERAAIRANVFFTPELDRALSQWIGRHYRDRLLPVDLADPLLARESMTALDELTGILGLGSVYDFQRP
jgi:succinylarginine dihydrolase